MASTSKRKWLDARLAAFGLSAAVIVSGAVGCGGTRQYRRAAQQMPSPAMPAPGPGQREGTLQAVQGIEGNADQAAPPFPTRYGPEQAMNVHLDLARAHESRDNHDAAVAEYQKAIEAAAGPGRLRGRQSALRMALAQRRMAAALDRMGRFTEAENHYQEAIKLAPNDPKIWNDAGYSKYLQGQWVEAEGRFKQAAKLAPEDTRVQTNLGMCLAAEGKSDEALTALIKAGGPAVAHANLGYILASRGKTAEARTHYLQALQLQPDLHTVRSALAKLGDPTPADRSTQIAQGVQPRSDYNVQPTSREQPRR